MFIGVKRIKMTREEVIEKYNKDRNLRRIDLSGINLERADLRGACLSWTNLMGADLRGANLKEAILIHANLENASLRDAHLTFADLRDSNLENADLTDSVLSGANLICANLTRAILYGAELRETRFSKPVILLNLHKHPLQFNFNNNELRIGCEIHSFEYWLENIEKIGKENFYSPDDIKIYRKNMEAIIEINKEEN